MKRIGEKHIQGVIEAQLFINKGIKYIRIQDPTGIGPFGRVTSYIPMSLIDKLREDEWAYDSTAHMKRKTT